MQTNPPVTHLEPAYRSALVISAILNIIMFFGEGTVGIGIGSAALIADAADFFEDASVYTLAVLALAWAFRQRAVAGLLMGFAMFGVGCITLWQVIARIVGGGAPTSLPMAITAAIALAVNLYCSYRLVRYKRGDASMRSIWLSTRNDAILNALTIVAALVIAITATAWPDIIAGSIIAAVNLWAAIEIIQQARQELAQKG